MQNKPFYELPNKKTDWEQGLSASYELVNGVVQLGFAILDKSPSDIINSVIGIYGAVQGIQGAIKGSQHTWFLHVRTLKLMAQHDPKKFFDYIFELEGEQRRQSSRFSNNAFSTQFVISLIEILDRMVHDKTINELIAVSVKNNERLLPAREAAVGYYAKIFTHPERYGNDRSMRQLVLQKLFNACSIPEPMLQRAAKSAAQEVYGYAESRKREGLGFWSNDFSLVSDYWATSALIGLQPADPHFSYPTETPALTNDYVAEAIRTKYPLFYSIEGMRYDSYQTLNNTVLNQDLETYIPVNATQSGKKDELFDLYEGVRNFLNTEEKVLLIHGNAGSGKSLFGRYLQHALWNEYQHGVTWVPVFVSLPA
ncbi:MAG: hypothetical protein LRY43_04425 [Gammaproteobacteria bacterium]|nr:hypothetical protein [Gammaproteobacteria bacterium]